MLKKRLICITPVAHIADLLNRLEKHFDVLYEPEIDYEALCQKLRDDASIRYIYTNPNKQQFLLDQNCLKGTSVTHICTASTGTNHIEKSVKQSVDVVSLTTAFQIINRISSTAEMAVTLMLSILRNLPAGFDSVKKGEWNYEPFIGRQLNSLTVGIIGHGRLGTLFEGYCKGLRMDTIVYDPKYEDGRGKSAQLDRLIEHSDVIALHIHVTDENRGFLCKDKFERMTKAPVIVNTSRGEIVNELDLLKALESGKVAGYATDVITDEFGDITRSPLWKSWEKHNVIITPHVAGMTSDGQEIAYHGVLDLFLEKLKESESYE